MRRYCCPSHSEPGVDDDDQILGCDNVFEAEPDSDGYVDCPECGLFFRASLHDVTED
jgi:hypothetical protein